MNPQLKNVLVISAKQGLNALLVNTAASQFWPQIFTIHTKAGLFNFLYLIGAQVGAREVAVWLPVLLRWSTTNADPTL